jgi:hypothetical protein
MSQQDLSRAQMGGDGIVSSEMTLFFVIVNRFF